MNEEKESLDEEILRVERVLAALKKRRDEEEPWKVYESTEKEEYLFPTGSFTLSCFGEKLLLMTERGDETDDDNEANDKTKEMMEKLTLFPLMEKYVRKMAVVGDDEARRIVKSLNQEENT